MRPAAGKGTGGGRESSEVGIPGQHVARTEDAVARDSQLRPAWRAPRRQCPAERLRDYFGRVGASGNRLLALLNDLLDLSKLEAGRMKMDVQDCKLDEVVVEVIAEFEAMCVDKALSLGVSMPQGGLPARVDAVRIGQVVRNLLSNAIKFTPEGGRIDVSLSKGSMPSGRRNTDFEAMPAARLQVPTPGSGSRRRSWRASSTSSYRVPRPPRGGRNRTRSIDLLGDRGRTQRADSCPQQRCGRADFVVELPLLDDEADATLPWLEESTQWGHL